MSQAGEKCFHLWVRFHLALNVPTLYFAGSVVEHQLLATPEKRHFGQSESAEITNLFPFVFFVSLLPWTCCGARERHGHQHMFRVKHYPCLMIMPGSSLRVLHLIWHGLTSEAPVFDKSLIERSQRQGLAVPIDRSTVRGGIITRQSFWSTDEDFHQAFSAEPACFVPALEVPTAYIHQFV